MAYELILPPDTQNDIREYISERFDDLVDQLAALSAIVAELEKLAANHGLGIVHYGGPFETRPIYHFSIAVGGVTRHLKAAYTVLRKDRKIVISGVVLATPIL